MRKIILPLILLVIFLFLSINLTKAGLEDPSYMIDTTSYGMGSDNIDTYQDAEDTVDDTLEIIVEKLMIGFGVFALFIMTVGGGYMIFAHGQDELLNKGKSIFSAGIISLIVALGSGIIMKIVITLLY